MVLLQGKKRMAWEVPHPEEVIEFPAGLQVPARILFTIEDSPDGFDTFLEVEWVDERYACTEIRVNRRKDGPAVSAEVLRSIPVQEFMRQGILIALLKLGGRTKDEEVNIVERMIKPPKGLADQGPTDETLRWVAQIYEFAYSMNEPPTKSVQDQLGVSRATAGRWVAAARLRGLLTSGEG